MFAWVVFLGQNLLFWSLALLSLRVWLANVPTHLVFISGSKHVLPVVDRGHRVHVLIGGLLHKLFEFVDGHPCQILLPVPRRVCILHSDHTLATVDLFDCVGYVPSGKRSRHTIGGQIGSRFRFAKRVFP